MASDLPGTPATSDELRESVSDIISDDHGDANQGWDGCGYRCSATAGRIVAEVLTPALAEARVDEQRKVAEYIDAVTADIDRLVAETRADERRKVADEIERLEPESKYTVMSPPGSNVGRVMRLIVEDAARIARGDL